MSGMNQSSRGSGSRKLSSEVLVTHSSRSEWSRPGPGLRKMMSVAGGASSLTEDMGDPSAE